MTDALSAEKVVPLLRGRFGRDYRYHASVPSTQHAFGEGDGEGATAVAEEQTAGRGRLGRSWHAPPGSGILVSVLLRPPDARLAPQLSLVGGLAAARALERALTGPAALKWPNDVLVDGRKVAGVLAEGRAGGVVLGIGLNVNQRMTELPHEARTPAASLRSIDGRKRDRVPILVDLLAELEDAYGRWRTEGLPALHGDIASRDFLLGRNIEIGGIAGTAVGIADDGCLLVKEAGIERRVGSGEVVLR
jgi:BirA family biotin operon repressor/biotin-[acetyl-CoA-carboxylase] ligase